MYDKNMVQGSDKSALCYIYESFILFFVLLSFIIKFKLNSQKIRGFNY